MTRDIDQPIVGENAEATKFLPRDHVLRPEAIAIISELSTFLGEFTGQRITFLGSKAFSHFWWYGPEDEYGDLSVAVDLYFNGGEQYVDYLAEPVALEQRLIGFLTMRAVGPAPKELVEGPPMKAATTTGPKTVQ